MYLGSNGEPLRADWITKAKRIVGDLRGEAAKLDLDNIYMDNAKCLGEDPLVRVPGIVSAKFSPIRLVEYEQWKSFLGGK